MKAQILRKEFISIGEDKKGIYVSGTKRDFNYVKECAKNEFNINIEFIESSLQSDDSIKHHFKINQN